MANVGIIEIEQRGMDSEDLYAGWLEMPTGDYASGNYTFPISGWVLGRANPAVAVEVRQRSLLLRRVPIDIERPDIASGFPTHPDREGARTSGFATAIGTLGLAPDFVISVDAILTDDRRVPLAVIRGNHQPLRSTFAPSLHPLMVTSLPRSGSTLAMLILANHPQIVLQRLHAYETRWGAYWIHTLKVAAEPNNFTRHRHLADYFADFHTIHPHPFNFVSYTSGPEINSWLNEEYPEQLAAFYQQRIEELYRHMAHSQGQEAPRYYAEKSFHGMIPDIIWELYPRAREIFLVRDFRDMACSMMRFIALPQRQHFEDARQDDPATYVRFLCEQASSLAADWHHRSTRAHLVRYEDLIQHPAETIREIFAYLDVPLSDAEVSRLIERAFTDSDEYRSHRTSEGVEASIGRWKHDLAPALAAIIEDEIGDVLAAFGYAEGGRRAGA
jgi:hypothetical protein